MKEQSKQKHTYSISESDISTLAICKLIETYIRCCFRHSDREREIDILYNTKYREREKERKGKEL